MGSAPEATPRKPSRRTGPVTLGLVGLQVLVVWLLIGNSYYQNDDWMIFAKAQELGFGLPLLLLEVYQHFSPVNRLLHWFVQTWSPGGYELGRAIIAVCLLTWLLALRAICRVTGAGPFRSVVALWPAGFSMFTVSVALWWGAAVHVLPAAAGSSLTIALFLQWHRRGGTSWLAASWFSFAATLLTQERPVIVLPYLVLLHSVVLVPAPLFAIPRRLLRDWRVWTPFVVIAVAFSSWFARHYYHPLPHPGAGQMARFMLYAAARFASGLVGLQNLGAPVGPGALVDRAARAGLVLALAGVASWTIHRNRWNVRPWLFFFLALSGNLAMLGWARVGKYGVDLVGSNPQYYVDACLLLAVSILLLRPPEDQRGWVPALAAHPRLRAATVVLLLGTLCVTTADAWLQLRRRNPDAPRARTWFESAQAALQAPSSTKYLPYALLGNKAPFLAADFLDPFNRLPVVLRIMTRVPRPDDASADRRILNERGNPVPIQARILSSVSAVELARTGRVRLSNAAASIEGDRLCVTAGQNGSVTLTLPAALSAPALVTELTFRAEADLSVFITPVSGGRHRYPVLPTTLFADRAHSLHWLDQQEVEGLALVNLPAGNICIERLAVAAPHFPPDATGACAAVDGFGLRGDPVECGGPWSPL